LWQALSKTAQSACSSCWDWLDIRAGIPFVQPATLEAFVPQMLNFEIIDGVNFKKGCYPGQEVVARMHYLGKPKRRMYLAHVEGDAAQAGNELFSAELEGQACGTVVNAAPAPGGGYDLLAVVQSASHDSLPVHLGSLSSARLQFQPLPYALP
jgi:folate-binding protein YgfZ